MDKTKLFLRDLKFTLMNLPRMDEGVDTKRLLCSRMNFNHFNSNEGWLPLWCVVLRVNGIGCTVRTFRTWVPGTEGLDMGMQLGWTESWSHFLKYNPLEKKATIP
jgi:hypothetical protein